MGRASHLGRAELCPLSGESSQATSEDPESGCWGSVPDSGVPVGSLYPSEPSATPKCQLAGHIGGAKSKKRTTTWAKVTVEFRAEAGMGCTPPLHHWG